MKNEKNLSLKVWLTLLIGFVVVALGTSKSVLAGKLGLLLREKFSIAESDSATTCVIETEKKNVSLFVSCGGYLE